MDFALAQPRKILEGTVSLIFGAIKEENSQSLQLVIIISG